MPFVRILVRPAVSESARRAIADGVHDALVRAIGIPAADRFQAVSTADDLIYDRAYTGGDRVERSDATAFIHITFVRGRSEDQKRTLYRLIVENLRAAPGLSPDDVFVTLVENERIDWSPARGLPL